MKNKRFKNFLEYPSPLFLGFFWTVFSSLEHIPQNFGNDFFVCYIHNEHLLCVCAKVQKIEVENIKCFEWIIFVKHGKSILNIFNDLRYKIFIMQFNLFTSW